MLHLEQLKNDAMKALVLTKQEAVFLDFAAAIERYARKSTSRLDENDNTLQKLGKQVIKAKYGNLFQMYEKIVDQNPYETPMMIYPAVHYTMGGVWVDYNLMTTVPGCFAIGEANFPIMAPTDLVPLH